MLVGHVTDGNRKEKWHFFYLSFVQPISEVEAESRTAIAHCARKPSDCEIACLHSLGWQTEWYICRGCDCLSFCCLRMPNWGVLGQFVKTGFRARWRRHKCTMSVATVTVTLQIPPVCVLDTQFVLFWAGQKRHFGDLDLRSWVFGEHSCEKIAVAAVTWLVRRMAW